jgi:hypothetical protein
LQIAQDGIRVGGDFAPSTLLSCARAKELRFGEYGERRVGQGEASEFGCDGERERSATGDKILPAVDCRGTQTRATQQFIEYFAASG